MPVTTANANGNMTKDSRRGLDVEYNLLNLPSKVTNTVNDSYYKSSISNNCLRAIESFAKTEERKSFYLNIDFNININMNYGNIIDQAITIDHEILLHLDKWDDKIRSAFDKSKQLNDKSYYIL